METPYQQFKELRPCKRIVSDLLAGKDFDSVLEVGAQWGENLMAIKDRFPDVKLTGIDIDEKTTKEAKEITGLDLRVGDIFTSGFKDGEFDVVFVEAVLCMLTPEEIIPAINELLRIAKKYIVLVELEISEGIGSLETGNNRTAADYFSMFPKVEKRKITQEEWDAEPWKTSGYSYLITK